ncbi:hypothetical protein GGF46_002859 [Coemansia sp. RSA 552]|nr:hypothetical protein GGF46_002859 [Coemansia sp. RSA 552]
MMLGRAFNAYQAAWSWLAFLGGRRFQWVMFFPAWFGDMFYSLFSRLALLTPSPKKRIAQMIAASRNHAEKTGLPNEKKLAIVTGANSGIGLEAAEALGRAGFMTILACRNPELGQAAVAELVEKTGIKDRYEFKQLNLASLDSIDKFVADINAREGTLDILLNNAGVMASPYGNTKDGLESQFGVNHVGPFVLTTGLLTKLKANPNGARIINLSSIAAWMQKTIDYAKFESEKKYYHWHNYGLSKLCSVLFTTALVRQLEGTKVTVNVVHPGTVSTSLMRESTSNLRKLWHLLQKTAIYETIKAGALTSIYLALSPDVEGVSGKFYARCSERRMHPTANVIAQQDALWEYTEKAIAEARST